MECLNLDTMKSCCDMFIDPNIGCICLNIVPFWCHNDVENYCLLADSNVEETIMNMVGQEHKLLA